MLAQRKETLVSSIFLNDLILGNIFTNLVVKDSLPFRLVCTKWRLAINREISREFCAHFKVKKDIVLHTPKGLHPFQTLKISRLEIEVGIPEVDLHTPELIRILRECGPQVKYLSYRGIFRTIEDWIWVKNILTLTPNLEQLRLYHKMDGSTFCEVFQDFCHLNLKSLRFSQSYSTTSFEGVKEDFVKTISKVFPSLETNFGIEEFDCVLLKMLNAKENSLKLAEFLGPVRDFYHKEGNEIELLSQLAKTHPLSKLELIGIPKFGQERAEIVANIYKKLKLTLKEIILAVEPSETNVEMKFPLMPKLRRLRLGSDSSCGQIFFSWEMGASMAKNFPLLEYFIYKPGYSTYGYTEDEEDEESEHLDVTKDWKIWNPFLPLENVSTLVHFKFLKFVDLGIPKAWIGPRENRQWGKKVLKTYSILYGGIENNGFLKLITDWLLSSDVKEKDNLFRRSKSKSTVF